MKTLLFMLLVTGGFYNAYSRVPGLQSLSEARQLYFVENKGQVVDQNGLTRKDIDFKLGTEKGLSIFIGKGKIEYQWSRNNILPARGDGHALFTSTGNPASAHTTDLCRMDVTLVGANPDALLVVDKAQPYEEHYYTSGNKLTTRSYNRITYKNIYPHIDWTFYFNAQGKLEHDFIVQPGGDVSVIRLRYGGASSIAVNDDGSLTALTPMGQITESAPLSYSLAQGKKSLVSSGYILNQNELSFQTGDYKGSLVIDPSLEWATYFGGKYAEAAYALASDHNGGLYICGMTQSSENIATTGAYQQGRGGAELDAYVAKFDVAGKLLWATYYGGDRNDEAYAVVCDGVGGVYIAGVTESLGLVTTPGCHQPVYGGGGSDGFIAKFDTKGTLQFSTYYGGDGLSAGAGQHGYDIIRGIAYDQSGHIYITGTTLSASGIATPNAYMADYCAFGTGKYTYNFYDAFLVKLDTSGKRLWGTYYGDGGWDKAQAIACDQRGNVYIAGSTTSSEKIATKGAHQTVINASFALGQDQPFVAKFDDKGALLWGSYYGGEAGGEATGITCDNNDAIYFSGFIDGNGTGISTPGAHQTVYGGGMNDGFLAKFSGDGKREWGTYYGGDGQEGVGRAFVCNYDSKVSVKVTTDFSGNVFLVGGTTSTDRIATSGSIQEYPAWITGGGWDFFIAKFNSYGDRQWGTYYGGISEDYATDIVCDKGELYVSGLMNSGGMDVKADKAGSSGDAEAFLLRITECDKGKVSITVNGRLLGTTGNDYASWQWYRDGVLIPGAQDATYSVEENGDYSVSVKDSMGCSDSAWYIVTNITGIAEQNTAGELIKIYPNPVKNTVYVQSPVALQARIASIDGRILQKESLAPGVQIFNLTRFAPGLYWVSITDKNGHLLKVEKILKQ